MSLLKFITKLKEYNEIVEISTNINPYLEVAELTERQCKSPNGGKAILFSNTGTQFPVLTNMMGSINRLNTALRVTDIKKIEIRLDQLFNTVTSPKKTVWEKLALIPTMKSLASYMPKHSSKKGECFSHNIPVDLSLLPILTSAPYDVAPFFTLPLVHTIDPITKQQNVGMYRMQVIDNQTTAMHWHTHKTGANHYRKYKELNERMPVVVCLGGDPLYTYSATAPMPEGIDEYILTGFLRERAVELVKCRTCEIEVPADVDFVIEGYIDTNEELFYEGPFGDHTGFYSLEDYYPRFHITHISHRKNAIFPATIVGIPPMEDVYFAIASERIFLKPIQMVIAPEVTDIWMPKEGVAHNIVVVSINKTYAGQAIKVANALWGAGQMSFNKFCVVVSHKDNMSMMDNILDALHNFNPTLDCTTIRGTLDILDHATPTLGYGGKMCIDLTDKLPQEVGSLVVNPLSVNEIPTITPDITNQQITPDNTTAISTSNEPPTLYKILHEPQYKAPIELIVDNNIPLDTSIETIIWLIAANCDPLRDITISANNIIIDGKAKVDKLMRHPNIVCQSQEVINLVDRRWQEYNIGAFIPSPSLKYIPLRYSNNAQINKMEL